MSDATFDERFMDEALELAVRGRYGVSPNPVVGAVVVRHGEIVGRGYHRQAGRAHAEIEALEDAGEAARGSTVYVTLEPCCHHGRTPPCVDALLAAGVSRVVASHLDPNPIVAGKGLGALRERGVEVEAGLRRGEAVKTNWRYLVAAVRKRPAVTLKWAMTMDGRIATATGDSQWISSSEGRRWALELREEHDAVVVGSGTALADDPRLTRRLDLAPGPNVRVVLDRRLRLGPRAKVLREPGPVLIYTETDDVDRRGELEEAGAVVIAVERVMPLSVLEDLWERGVRSVLVEGGSAIHGAFVRVGAFDRVAVACAPVVVGGSEAPGPVGGDGFPTLRDALRLDTPRVLRRDGDVIMEAFREGCLRDLSESVAG